MGWLPQLLRVPSAPLGINSDAENSQETPNPMTGWFGVNQVQPFQLSTGQLWKAILAPKFHLGQLSLDLPCNLVFPCDRSCFLSYPSQIRTIRAPVKNILHQTPSQCASWGNPTWHREWMIHTVSLRPFTLLPLRFQDGKGSMIGKKLMEVDKFKKNQSQYIWQDYKELKKPFCSGTALKFI